MKKLFVILALIFSAIVNYAQDEEFFNDYPSYEARIERFHHTNYCATYFSTWYIGWNNYDGWYIVQSYYPYYYGYYPYYNYNYYSDNWNHHYHNNWYNNHHNNHGWGNHNENYNEQPHNYGHRTSVSSNTAGNTSTPNVKPHRQPTTIQYTKPSSSYSSNYGRPNYNQSNNYENTKPINIQPSRGNSSSYSSSFNRPNNVKPITPTFNKPRVNQSGGGGRSVTNTHRR